MLQGQVDDSGLSIVEGPGWEPFDKDSIGWVGKRKKARRVEKADKESPLF